MRNSQRRHPVIGLVGSSFFVVLVSLLLCAVEVARLSANGGPLALERLPPFLVCETDFFFFFLRFAGTYEVPSVALLTIAFVTFHALTMIVSVTDLSSLHLTAAIRKLPTLPVLYFGKKGTVGSRGTHFAAKTARIM